MALQMLFWIGGSLALGWAFFDSLVIGGLIVLAEVVSVLLVLVISRRSR